MLRLILRTAAARKAISRRGRPCRAARPYPREPGSRRRGRRPP